MVKTCKESLARSSVRDIQSIDPPTPVAVERVGRPSFYVIPLLILSLRIHSRIISKDLALHSRMLLRLLGLLGPSPPRYIAKNNNVIFFIIDI